MYQAAEKYASGSTFIVSHQEKPKEQVYPDVTLCRYTFEGAPAEFLREEEEEGRPAVLQWLADASHDGKM